MILLVGNTKLEADTLSEMRVGLEENKSFIEFRLG
jgi:hypothetical protein